MSLLIVLSERDVQSVDLVETWKGTFVTFQIFPFGHVGHYPSTVYLNGTPCPVVKCEDGAITVQSYGPADFYEIK